jgi:hypothetical protein
MLRRIFVAIALALITAAPAFAQSQAANGTIEGTVADSSGGVLPGVTVTITNTDTGLERSLVSNAEGQYRGLLLPLGSYRVAAELQGFKKSEQTGIVLRAGDTATINFSLAVGTVSETVTITAEAPIAQPGKIDLGRTINDTEIHNLPLPSRNPYNFAFLQANVTGYENTEFGVPRINANGSQMHTNYQLDGNTNTEKDRAGLRLLPISEVLVREVKVVTNGFAPEFGQTTGMVYNAITQSGTNNFNGTASYRFKRNAMSTTPFFLASGARKPDTEADDVTATLGGPIKRDKAFFFGAYEYVNRSLISGGQIISVSPDDAQRLGITLPASGVIPADQKVPFAFGKVDYQVTPSTLVTGRVFYFRNLSLSNIGGGLTTTDRATDFHDQMSSTALQAVTTIGNSKLNEFRFQYAQRHQYRTIGTGVDGPAITVSGIANFGGPRIGDTNSVGFDFSQGITQVIDNFTWVKGSHAFKGGLDLQYVADDRTQGDNFLYTFPTIDAYLAAKSGANPFGYSTLVQTFGDLDISYNSRFYGFFVQDDWQMTPRIKLLYGVRYDLFDVPQAVPYALNPYSNDFTIDKNNWGPRAGLSWALDDSGQTVLRASIGRMFEPPLIDFYDNSILNNGDPSFRYNVSLSGTAAGAPAFPASLASSSTPVLPRQTINAVDPDFETQEAWLSNVQVERALTQNMSVSIGYVNAIGRKLPVLVDVNLIPTGVTLGDGRATFASTISAQTRVNPAFNHIDMFQSIGESTYNAFTATLTRRMVNGLQAQATYTLARGVDNAPLTGSYIVGSGDDRLSDPTDLDRDKGVTPFNQTHTLAISTVYAPQVTGDGIGAYLANNNQLGIVVQANSGLPFNIRSNRDLNGDGVSNNDRPLGVERNSGRLGTVFNVDLRYSRFIPIAASTRGEVFVEAKNIFNRQNIAGVNRTVTTDAAGNPVVDITDTTATPDRGFPFSGTSGYDQRIIQVGFKVSF